MCEGALTRERSRATGRRPGGERAPRAWVVVAGALLAAGFASAPAPAGPTEALTDPTRPPAVHRDTVRRLAQRRPQSFVVTGITISPDERKAIVNDQLVREGDRVGEALVKEIMPGAVVLDYLSQTRRISLLPFQVRRDAVAR